MKKSQKLPLARKSPKAGAASPESTASDRRTADITNDGTFDATLRGALRVRPNSGIKMLLSQSGLQCGFVLPDGREVRPQIVLEVHEPATGKYTDVSEVFQGTKLAVSIEEVDTKIGAP